MGNKRVKYKLNVIPVLIACGVLILILGILVSFILSLLDKNNDINDMGNSSLTTPVDNSATNDNSDDEVNDDSSEVNTNVNDDVNDDSTVDANIAGTTSDLTPAYVPSDLPAGLLTDWNLILINYDNYIPVDFISDKTKFDSKEIDVRLKTLYTNMYEAAKLDGIWLYLRSGYRTLQEQNVTYNASIQKYISGGMTREAATIETKKTLVEPGYGEYQTGLGLEIISPEYHMGVFFLNETFAQTDTYAWLKANAHIYGFVERYPADKTEITKVSYKPWHFRFVGVEHAQYMNDNNLCLEEYVAILQAAER